MKKISFFALVFIFLAACSSQTAPEAQKAVKTSKDATPHKAYSNLKRREVNLPAGKTHNFRCQQGGGFSLQFSDGSRETAKLQFMGQTHNLKRQANFEPAIYSDGNIALFATEKSILLGREYSAEILASACTNQ